MTTTSAPAIPQKCKAGRVKRKRWRKTLLILILILLICAACSHFKHHNTLTVLDKDWVTVNLLPVNKYSRPGIALSKVNGLVIHYTGNPNTTAEQTRSYFSNLATTGETYASSHFIIGMDGTILQCVPLNEEAYCSNSRNVDTISIECCHPDESGKFSEQTYNALIKLARYLIQVYHLDSDDVIRHYDVTGKLCPYYYVKHEDAWMVLKEDIFQGIPSFSFWPF